MVHRFLTSFSLKKNYTKQKDKANRSQIDGDNDNQTTHMNMDHFCFFRTLYVFPLQCILLLYS